MDEHLSQDREALLQAFATRLSTSVDNLRTPDYQLLPGQLPGDLPFHLPLPQDCSVLGSLLQTAEEVEILLDAIQSPDSILTFYKEQLLTAGWSELYLRIGGVPGGFVPTGHATHQLFYLDNPGPALIVTVQAEKVGRTDVWLRIDRRMRARGYHQDLHFFKQPYAPPFLYSPEGARHVLDGMSANDESATNSAVLETATKISLANLSAHYAAQLEQAGCVWMRREVALSPGIPGHSTTRNRNRGMHSSSYSRCQTRNVHTT